MVKEDFIFKIREIHDRNGSITQKDIINEKGLNYRLVYKYFDNFSNMCKELNLKTNSNLQKKSEEVIDILRDIYNKNSHISAKLIKLDGRTSCDTIKRKFGSLVKGYEAANIKISKGRKLVSKEEIDLEINRIHNEYGYVSKPLFEKFSTYSPKIIQRIYGSFSNMYLELNMPRHKSGIIPSDNDLINECKRLYDKYKYLSYDIIERFGEYSITCYKDRARVNGWDGINHYREKVGCPKPELDWCESPESRRIYNMYCDVLDEKGIKEKRFDWLKYEGKHLRIDMFFTEHKIAIEYNGPQHYFVDGYYTKNEKDLERKQKIDKEKYRLMQEHGYKLIVIPYYDKVNIDYVNNTISNK